MGYGVPPMLIGISGESTFNNIREARMAFWETTIFYYLNYLRGELNNWFFPKGTKESDVFLDYVLDDVPALALKRDEVWARCQKSDFLTVNEKREMIGMPTLGSKGDIILVQAALIPLEYVGTNFTDTQNSVDTNKSVQDLIDLGYSKEEAKQMIGL
jgi:phage portal protein BeeE